MNISGLSPTRTVGSVTVIGMHYEPETTGNAPYTTAMATALARAGYNVRVITGVPHYPEWRVRDKYQWGLRWFEHSDGVDILRLRHFVPRRPDMVGRLAMEVTFLIQALPRILRDGSDVVVAISPTLSGLTAAVLGRRGRSLGLLVQDLNGFGAREAGVAGGKAARAIESVEMGLMRRTDKIGVIAPRFAEIISRGASIEPSRFVDLPNFTHIEPVSDVSQEQSRAFLAWPVDRFIVVHTGNMGMKQGLDVVVEAARISKSHQDWLYVMVGDGNQRSDLQRRALGCDNILFVDPLDTEAYPHALNAADVLLLAERPGVREMSLPSKLTSYAVAARPIVASVASDGLSGTLLRRCAGAMLVEPGEPELLVRALAEIRSDENLRQRLVRGSSALRDHVGGRAEADRRYVGFVDRLIGASELEGEADCGPKPTVMVAEPHGAGHRFRYVRLLVQQAPAEGWQPTVCTTQTARSRSEFTTHLGDMTRGCCVIDCRGDLSSIEVASRRAKAVHTVIPDADLHLPTLALRGWRGAGTLSILVMRFPAGRDLLRPRMLAKRAAIWTLRFRRGIHVGRLVSGISRDLGPNDVADPVTLKISADSVSEIRQQMDPEMFWFLVIGSITRRKNLDSIVRALAKLDSSKTGLMIAGNLDADARAALDQALTEHPECAPRVLVHDAMLSEGLFDGFLAVADCVVVAHSNNGPSGVLAKAVAAGTRVLAAGAPSLRSDCDVLGSGTIWTPLEPESMAVGMREMMHCAAPASARVATSQDFARSLLPPRKLAASQGAS